MKQQLDWISGREFIEKFCAAHDIPTDAVAAITLYATHKGFVEFNVEFIGDRRITQALDLLNAARETLEGKHGSS